jgi:hypothetical protein
VPENGVPLKPYKGNKKKFAIPKTTNKTKDQEEKNKISSYQHGLDIIGMNREERG